MDEKELQQILESHGKWLRGEEGGERANLHGADLRNTNLLGVNLRGAYLGGADLSEKIIQVGPIGSRKNYTVYWANRNIVQCGCWNGGKGGSLAEFKKRIDEVYPEDKPETLRYRREYLAAIAMFEMLRGEEEK